MKRPRAWTWLRPSARTRPSTRKVALVGTLAAALVGSGVVVAHGEGYPTARVALSGGGAWLASPTQGLVTLIDGASEQVVGSLRAPGAQRADDLAVVQSGASAYVVNGTQGTVSRVDGATYEASPAVRFADSGGGSLRVFSGTRDVYAVDGARRLASVADPRSLAVREQLSLAAQPGPGQSIVDKDGRLWVIDKGGSGLSRFDGRHKLNRPGLGDESSQLVLVQGQPVLVDLSRSRLGRLNDEGNVAAWSCLETRAREQVQLTGSQSAARVYAAIPATGTLVAASLDRDDCSAAVVVGRPGDDFGPLVETAGYVFVPDRTTGETVVVDVTTRAVTRLSVLKPGSGLELLVKDGFVFYNNQTGDEAGVIRFDGGQWRAGRSLKKYDPANTGRSILTPGGANAGVQPQPDRPVTPPAGNPPKADQPAGQQPANQPRPPTVDNPVPAPKPSTPTAPLVAPVIRDITWVPATPVRGLPVTFTGTVANAQGASWKWTLARPNGSVASESTAADAFTYTLPAGQDRYTIKLEVTGPGGTAEPLTKTVTTTAELHPQIDSLIATPRSPMVGEPVTISASESVAGARGVWSWQITNLDTGASLPSPTSGAGQTTFGMTFTAAGRYRVRLTVTADGASDQRDLDLTVAARVRLTVTRSGTGTGTIAAAGLACTGNTCTGVYRAGTTVSIVATPAQRSKFDGFTGCPGASNTTCSIGLVADAQIGAAFSVIPDTTPPTVTLTANGKTVRIGSGVQTVEVADMDTEVNVRATATDPEGGITNVKIVAGYARFCGGPDGGGSFEATGTDVTKPVASGRGPTVSYSASAWTFPAKPTCVVTAATQFIQACATSAGGKSVLTSLLIVNWNGGRWRDPKPTDVNGIC